MKSTRLERTKESFREKIQSQSPDTQEGIFVAINNFETFSMEKYGKVNLIPDLKESSEEEVYDVLQSWINWNNSRAPSTVKMYFSRLKKYLHYMGVKLHDQDIKNELDFKHLVNEELYGLTIEDIQKIFKQFSYNSRVQFMCQLSGLMRIGETVQLRKKHLILGKENIIVKIPSSIAKFKKGRTTFFSKEASRLLRPILRRLENDNDLIFAKNEKVRYAELNSEQTLRRTLVKVGLDMKYESTNRFFINTHSFRAYGITKLSRHDANFAKRIAGQKGYLDQYDRLTDDEKLELYQKFEIDLIIDDTAKLTAENAKLVKYNSKLEQVQEEKLLLSAKLSRFEHTTYTKKQVEEMFEDLKKELKKKIVPSN